MEYNMNEIMGICINEKGVLQNCSNYLTQYSMVQFTYGNIFK